VIKRRDEGLKGLDERLIGHDESAQSRGNDEGTACMKGIILRASCRSMMKGHAVRTENPGTELWHLQTIDLYLS
jgi:hypothetical protein